MDPIARTNSSEVARPPSRREVFTTGQVAAICKVAPRTVTQWFDRGRLRGYRIPGSNDRRIPRLELLRFLKEYGLPSGELTGGLRILLVGVEGLLAARLTLLLPAQEGFELLVAEDAFQAGSLHADFNPGAVLLDFELGRGVALTVAGHLRKAHGPGLLLVGLAAEDGLDETSAAHFGRTLQKPFDPLLLAEQLRAHAESLLEG